MAAPNAWGKLAWDGLGEVDTSPILPSCRLAGVFPSFGENDGIDDEVPGCSGCSTRVTPDMLGAEFWLGLSCTC